MYNGGETQGEGQEGRDGGKYYREYGRDGRWEGGRMEGSRTRGDVEIERGEG